MANIVEHYQKFHALFHATPIGVASNPNYRDNHKHDCTCRNCGAPDQDDVCAYCHERLDATQRHPH